MKRRLLAVLLVSALTISGTAGAAAVSADDFDEAWLMEGDLTEEELDAWVDEPYTEGEFYVEETYDDYDNYDYDDVYYEEPYVEEDSGGSVETAEEAAQSAASSAASAAESAAAGTTTPAAGTTKLRAKADETEYKKQVEETLNLKNNKDQEWTYDKTSDAWTLSITDAVAYPVIADEEGVSVCVPGAYVTGIDTDGDGKEDVTAASASQSVKGSLVIDRTAHITSSNGQYYTADTAPVIINTGAAGYSEQENQTAAPTYAKEGYINVACGNRGKQSTAADTSGKTYYTGDAPSCLVDQKNAIRFVKYNILLGNLPGSVDHFVSTGGSGGGAHAAMVAATSNNPDFYDYEIEVGAVGVYKNADGSYSTTVKIGSFDRTISDGVWGTIAYSPITSLQEADMAMAFEYNLDPNYTFNTEFQKQTAAYLADAYMAYINGRSMAADEAKVGFDLNEDGDTSDTVPLTIEKNDALYADTNGYGGTYLKLYLNEFISGLQWYVDSLTYADDWTWFDEEGNAMTDAAVAAMTAKDRTEAFISGRYARGESMRAGGPGGMGRPDAAAGAPGAGPGAAAGAGGPLDTAAAAAGTAGGEINLLAEFEPQAEEPADDAAQAAEEGGETAPADGAAQAEDAAAPEAVGTPEAGTTQASGSAVDSKNYASYEDMLNAYKTDIAEIKAGDAYKKNIVSLYDPMQYIGAAGTSNPVWARLVCGASEGDISMMNSLNLEVAWLKAGTDAQIEWQWDGGHVPSEILGNSFSLYVDEMYGKHVATAVTVLKAAATPQTANGTEEKASGTDISSWVQLDSAGKVSFTLADIAAYRTSGAAKAIPGFDVIDYGQEDYVFGSETADARHWDEHVLDVFEAHKEELAGLFNR